MFQNFSNILREKNKKILNEIESINSKLKSVGRPRKEKQKLKKQKLQINDLRIYLNNNNNIQ